MNTLDELIAMGIGIHAHCIACNRAVLLDLPELRERHGGGMLVSRIALKLRCETCGRRDTEIRLSAPSSLQ